MRRITGEYNPHRIKGQSRPTQVRELVQQAENVSTSIESTFPQSRSNPQQSIQRQQIEEIRRLEAAHQNYSQLVGRISATQTTSQMLNNLDSMQFAMGMISRELNNLRRLDNLRDQILTKKQQQNRLSDDDIKRQKIIPFSKPLADGKTCAICLSDLQDAPALPALKLSAGLTVNLCQLICGHIFHQPCVIDGWIKAQSQKSCPLCRCDLRSEKNK